MQISKDFGFEAAHILPRHPGKCSRLHGHSYLIRVEVEGALHPKSQFVMDYGDLSDIVRPIVDLWDHRFLNAFVRYPSAENMAAHVAHLIRAKLQFALINRLVVGVSETRKTWAYWDSKRKEDVFMLDRAQEDAEWKSPDIKIPVGDIPMLQRMIDEQDGHIRGMLSGLTQSLIVREQYALYKATLIQDPEIPAAIRKQDIQ
jgi:6-pyruvoyltetrahydropterin/6-carboxytetrahydropterin synthase